jgi:hypothetical protein
MSLPILTNLTGQSVGNVLLPTQISIALDNGATCDYTVRQGVISGMGDGIALIGSGGRITPSTFDETTETKTPDTAGPEAKSVNLVRFDGSALKVNHANGDTVLYVCVINSAGDIVGKYVS